MKNKTANMVETKLERIAQISREKRKEVFTSIEEFKEMLKRNPLLEPKIYVNIYDV